MILERIQLNKPYPNYRRLCEELGEPVTTGAAKIKQLNRWNKCFNFVREGNSYIITEILVNDFDSSDFITLTHNKLCLILLAGYLHARLPEQKVQSLTLRRKELDEILGLVNGGFTSRAASRFISPQEKEFISEVRYRNSKFTDRVTGLFKAFSPDKEASLCIVTEQFLYRKVGSGFDELQLSSPELSGEISYIRNKLRDKYGAQHLGELFIRDQLKNYYKELTAELVKQLGIAYTESCITFTSNQYLLEMLVTQVIRNEAVLTDLYKQSNKAQVNKLLKQYANLHQKYIELHPTDIGEFKTEKYTDMPEELYTQKLEMVERFIQILDSEFKQIFTK